MSATVVLSVQDNFSTALDSYGRKVGTATGATEALAVAQEETSVTTGQLSEAELASAGNAQLLSDATSTAKSAMMGMAVAAGIVAAAVGGAKAAYDNTIGSALSLEAEVRKLSFETGANAEASSKLAYVADVTGVGVAKLSTAINIATRSLASNKSLGIEPNIDGLAKLSDMYLKIEDPIQRNAFLLHEFGRSGADMAPLMQLGSDGIKSLGDQATMTGNVLSGPALEALHKYDIQMNQLSIDAKGMGVALGVDILPAASRLVDGGLNLVHTLDLLQAAYKDGIITESDYHVQLVLLATGGTTLKNVFNDLSPKVQQVNYDMAHGSDASDRAAASQAYLTGQVTQTATSYSDAASLIAEYTGNINLQASTQLKAADAQALYNDQLQKANDKAMDRSTMLGVSGVVTKNEQTYQDVVSKNADKIAALRAEIAKYNSEQGQSITVTSKLIDATDQMDLANNKVLIGSERMQIAEEKLAQAHQGAKESAEAYATRLLGLRVAVQSAGDSWQQAQVNLDIFNSKLGATSSGTADYTSAIAKDQKALDDLTLANSRAEDAMHKANKEFVIQQAQAGLTGKALYDFELRMGEIDKPTYDAVTAIDAARATYDASSKDGGALQRYESATQLIIDKLNGVVAPADAIPDVLKPATDSFWNASDGADAAARNILIMGERMANLQDKTVTVTTRFVDETYASGGYTSPGSGGGSPAPTINPRDGTGGGTSGLIGSGTNSVTLPPRGGSSANGGSTVNVSIGAVHVGAGATPAMAHQVAAIIARQTRAQSLAGAGIMGN